MQLFCGFFWDILIKFWGSIKKIFGKLERNCENFELTPEKLWKNVELPNLKLMLPDYEEILKFQWNYSRGTMKKT